MQKNRRVIIGNLLFEEIPFENESILNNSEFIYTTHFWLNYLMVETKGKPVIIKISFNGCSCYFIGVIFKKFGFKLCGSPFEGWSTPYMGFLDINIFNEETRATIIKTTFLYLFKIKKCFYVQICDWNIDVAFAKKYSFKYEMHETYFLNISPSEDELFSSFKTCVRTNCRAFLRRGARLVDEEPSVKFCNDYYEQLLNVFERQKLKCFYSKGKLNRLFNSFSRNLDNIYCENVYAPGENKSIATGIFFGYKKRCYFFGAASYSNYYKYKPNDYVIWNAIKKWKNYGCTEFDMLGVRDYKEKFCPTLVQKPIIYASKIPFFHSFKIFAKSIIMLFRKKH